MVQTVIDTGYTIEEVKDSLADETCLSFRLLLADLHLGGGEYTDAKTVWDSLHVYFKEDSDLLDLRDRVLELFKVTSTDGKAEVWLMGQQLFGHGS